MCVFCLFRIVDESDSAIRTVMAELRVNMNQILAIEHEEFIANLNRKVRYTFFICIYDVQGQIGSVFSAWENQ